MTRPTLWPWPKHRCPSNGINYTVRDNCIGWMVRYYPGAEPRPGQEGGQVLVDSTFETPCILIRTEGVCPLCGAKL